MLDKFNHFISNQELVHKSQKILIAVSGGVDSMCMTELFRRTGYDIGIAHLNHGMRGNSSDEDEKLCKAYAKKHQIEFFSRKVDFSDITSNFQSEARRIRYKWLNQIVSENDYDLIATAHHKDDQIENFFIRINRNSGLNGLSGIKAKFNNIIRPLLFASKEDILLFVQSENIPFREDESNIESKYRRNFFRNEIIPLIEKKIPGYKYNVHSTIEKVNEANVLLNHLVSGIEDEVTFKENDQIFISLHGLKTFPSPQLILFYILHKYGLNRTQSDNLYEADTGAVIQSEKLIFLKNRSEIVIKKRSTKKSSIINIELFETPYPIGRLNEITLSKVDNKQQKNNESEIFISPEVKLPLTVRSRKEGDRFYPIGMDMKQKKVKKFLIDIKLNQFEKDAIQLLVDQNDEIIWVIGYRADERYKIDPEMEHVIKVKISKHSG
ncbi:tRNA lysidine(34) synthetase TilS [Portibacter lacus]|uniref:tRNA(Ile)-lysidine synthase n=1 Tax=Portibacter lacus TaxID=1099794 RepID=A0AA37WGM2_9BACT|nr:tRNA lysidine(34) synthetase TilS [Portibacter lacus]GLR20157.1 tRNA(Ile)-lysidine synthase [Portibacter lacus]